VEGARVHACARFPHGGSLPEYTSDIHKNEEGDEVIRFLKRDTLNVHDPRYETPRHPHRRVARGITSKALRINAIVE
jgi:hypothetical protein